MPHKEDKSAALEEVETVYARKNMEFAMMRRERDEAQRLQVLEWERAEAAERERDEAKDALEVTRGAIVSGMDKTQRAQEALAAKDEALRAALSELGVPSDYYPAPVANAVGILRAALAATEEVA